ncbi:S8 family peptidase [Lysobacter yananisis]|uniref:S8 family peptidase n=1 Tax=Lysobacter yananisis TaxID=1003114 RepID=A0ABY9PCV3_9GAMM|nr:S8 family peptidase [Lysobacter yananisis]WMT04726.1 S8 family peptidase [Lysobacter yananisis]
MSTQSTLRLRRHVLAAAVLGVIAAPAFASDRVDLSGLKADAPVDGFLVTYDAGAPKAAAFQRDLDIALASVGRKDLKIRHTRTISTGAELVEVNRTLDVVEAAALMKSIAADPRVTFVEPNARFYPTFTPNDTNYPSQWGLHGTWGIKANTAWDNTYQGQGKIIAVIDTGITDHPDLVGNLTSPLGYDFISNAATANDGGGRDADPHDPGDWTTAGQCGLGQPARNSSWHGTHVSGIAAGVTNNAAGIAGTAFKAKILSARVLGRCGGTLADIADAITWASGGTVSGVPSVGANKATVINMSLGGGGACSSTSAMQVAITNAYNAGTTVVVAAGNSNAPASGFQPASCANVINVGATTSAGVRASFSNHGSLVDVAAPGQSILSTLNAGTTTPGAFNYVNYNGTSMAAPFVAGIVALMQSKPSPDLSPAQVEQIIKSTASPFATPQSPTIGTGIANADAATDATP